MVCLDNSEWMRNGDYTPTRLEAQHDAANLVCGSKTQQNPENTVGILTMAGSGVQVLCSPTDDMGRILTASTDVKLGGKADLCAGLQIAQLALKHRKNKNGGQRIVVFVGSPIEADEAKLVKIAKQLKKANVAVDVISMGEQAVNEGKLQAFIEAVDKSSNSHLVAVPTGVLPSDVLITSPIITGEEGGAPAMGGSGGMGGGMGGGAFAEFGGVDPNMDPELAIALRVSMEEARAEAERKAGADAAAPGAGAAAQDGGPKPAASASAPAPAPAPASAAYGDDMMDEDAMLQQALMMSMAEGEAAAKAAAAAAATASPKAASKPSSPKAAAAAPAPAAAGMEGAAGAASFMDPDFVKGLLTGLPGVDINDPKIKAAMAGVLGSHQDEEEQKKKKSKGEPEADKKGGNGK